MNAGLVVATMFTGQVGVIMAISEFIRKHGRRYESIQKENTRE